MDTRPSNPETNKSRDKNVHREGFLLNDETELLAISNTQIDRNSGGIPGGRETEDRSAVDDDADILQNGQETEGYGRSMPLNLQDIFQSLAQHLDCTCHSTQHAGWSEQAIDSTPGTPMLSSSDHCSGYSSFGASNRGSFFGTRSGNLSHSDSFSGTRFMTPSFTPPQLCLFSKQPRWPSTPVIYPDNSSLDLDLEDYDVDLDIPTSGGKERHDENMSWNSSPAFHSLPIPDLNQLGDELAASVRDHVLREITFTSDSNDLDGGANRQNSTCSKDQTGSSMNPQVGSQRNLGSDGGNEKQDQPGNEVEHETQVSRMIQQYLELAVSLKHAKDQLDELEVIYQTEVSESSSNSSAQQSRERRIEYENQKALKSDHLDRTIKSVGEARLSCIMNAAFDPLREHVVLVTDRIEHGETAIEDERLTIIREILKSFERDEKSLWLVTPLLSPSLLRDVRAWSRLYGFGFKTLVYGSEEHCSVLIHKDREQLQSKFPDEATSRLPDLVTGREYGISQVNPIHGQPKLSTIKPWASSDNSLTASSETPQDDAASCISRSSVVPKKRRVAREDGAFTCLYQDCQKSFDRACDLKHHNRIHCPKDDLPHECHQCGKRFLFKKDKLRHEKTHQSRQS